MDNNNTTQQEPQEPQDPQEIKKILLPVKATVTDVQKEEFFKAFLADKPYTEVISLLNGRFNLKFRTLTVDENNDLIKQIAFDQISGEAKNTDYYFMKMTNYKLAMALISVNDLPFGPDVTKESFHEDKEKGVSYVSVKAEKFNSWPTYKLAATQAAFNEFERRVLTLTDSLNNADFWKAAE